MLHNDPRHAAPVHEATSGATSGATADRRGEDRRASDAPVTVRVEAQTIEGRADNVSDHGVFLFAPSRLSVEVTIDGRVRRGRIVRLQSMTASEIALAIELERE